MNAAERRRRAAMVAAREAHQVAVDAAGALRTPHQATLITESGIYTHVFSKVFDDAYEQFTNREIEP